MHFHHEPPDNSRSNERGVLRTELIIGQLRRKVRGIDSIRGMPSGLAISRHIVGVAMAALW